MLREYALVSLNEVFEAIVELNKAKIRVIDTATVLENEDLKEELLEAYSRLVTVENTLKRMINEIRDQG